MICREAESLTGTSKADRGRPTDDGPLRYLPGSSLEPSLPGPQRSAVIRQPSSYSRSIVSPGSTVIERKLDMRTRPAAAPLGFVKNLRWV
jgi:hypothetical protein